MQWNNFLKKKKKIQKFILPLKIFHLAIRFLWMNCKSLPLNFSSDLLFCCCKQKCCIIQVFHSNVMHTVAGAQIRNKRTNYTLLSSRFKWKTKKIFNFRLLSQYIFANWDNNLWLSKKYFWRNCCYVFNLWFCSFVLFLNYKLRKLFSDFYTCEYFVQILLFCWCHNNFVREQAC